MFDAIQIKIARDLSLPVAKREVMQPAIRSAVFVNESGICRAFLSMAENLLVGASCWAKTVCADKTKRSINFSGFMGLVLFVCAAVGLPELIDNFFLVSQTVGLHITGNGLARNSVK